MSGEASLNAKETYLSLHANRRTNVYEYISRGVNTSILAAGGVHSMRKTKGLAPRYHAVSEAANRYRDTIENNKVIRGTWCSSVTGSVLNTNWCRVTINGERFHCYDVLGGPKPWDICST